MPTYLIKVKIASERARDGDEQESERLVDAKNEAAAIRHVAKDTLTCAKATIADAVRFGKMGVEVEKAA